MKITEVEEIIRRDGLTDSVLSEFQSALTRVPKANRCQHCYTLAAELPAEKRDDAIRLIELGLEEYCSSWLDESLSCQNLARLYESGKDYPKALQAYQRAFRAVPEAQKASYAPEFASHMLRAELHCSGFRYTPELETYYQTAMAQDDFARSFLHKLFYQALAEMVIYTHQGAPDKAAGAYDRAVAMLSPAHEGPLTALLKRHRHIESTKATAEALSFLRAWGK